MSIKATFINFNRLYCQVLMCVVLLLKIQALRILNKNGAFYYEKQNNACLYISISIDV